MAKKTFPYIVMPPLVCAFAHCEKPDDKFGADKAKYKITVKAPKDQLDTLTGIIGGQSATLREILKLISDGFKEFDADPTHNPIKDGDTLVTKDGTPYDGMAGYYTVIAKTKSMPSRVDSQRNQLPLSVGIWSGDVVRVLLGPAVWQTAADTGFTLYLNEVMLIKKNATEIPVEDGGYVAPASAGSSHTPALSASAAAVGASVPVGTPADAGDADFAAKGALVSQASFNGDF